jgi:hypothetical protein
MGVVNAALSEVLRAESLIRALAKLFYSARRVDACASTGV